MVNQEVRPAASLAVSPAVGGRRRGGELGVAPPGPAGALSALVAAIADMAPSPGAVVDSLSVGRASEVVEAAGSLHLEALTTRVGTLPEVAELDEEIFVTDESGRTCGQASVRWRVSADEAGDGGPLAASLDVGSVGWGERLAERLGAVPAFASATGMFDGSIGIASGEREVNFRIYRGKIVEVARRSIDGSTFTVAAPEWVWVELLTGPMNDFVRRTGRGELSTRGAAFHYLRMIKALMLLIDEARAAVKEAAHA